MLSPRDLNRYLPYLRHPQGDKGNFIHLDPATGEVVIWDVMGGERYFNGARECFVHLRREFEQLEVFAVPDEVVPLGNEGDDRFKEIVRSLGWPPARDGESAWKKDEAMKEVKSVARVRVRSVVWRLDSYGV